MSTIFLELLKQFLKKRAYQAKLLQLFFQKLKKKFLNHHLTKASFKVREESMKVNAEFSEFEENLKR